MRRIVLGIALVLLISAGCARKEAPAARTETAATANTAASSTTAGSTTASSTAVPPSSDSQEPSLVSFSSGALIAQKPQEYNETWSAFWLLDEKGATGWATPKGVVTPQTIVIALSEKTELDRLEFDTAHTDGEHRGAKDISVEISDEDATSGFQRIADASLQDKVDQQSFPVSAKIPGRWVRLTVKNNWGSPEYLELMDFRGYGKQLTHTPFPNASGTYETNYGNFHVKQEGTSVTGCYEHGDGLLTGGIEGRIMKIAWSEGPDKKGPAMMVFDPSGQQMFGLWWNESDTESAGRDWNGKKISNDVGSCPHWAGTGAEATMQKELEDTGRTRVYGINFDTSSDVIRDESKPTIDKMAAMMKAKPEWKLTIEGHTDSSGGDAQNLSLSQRRADSVKSYLATAGIAAGRLTSKGFGSSKPLAGNETATGRAQNRRVELTRQ